MARALLLPLLVLLLPGCATMMSRANKYKHIQLVSDPPGAEIWMDGLRTGQTTPWDVSASNHEGHVFEFRLGEATARCELDTHVRGKWILFDLLAGGLLLGPSIDAATGAWSELDATACHVSLAVR